ncbi:MAG: hypothetical protein NTW96_08290 [Planctomycetia bacterium]|nr:hypothetical protein [Planctomycetia bacterium]
MARILGYVDAGISLLALMVLVRAVRRPRPVRRTTAVLLTLVAGTLLWANLRPTGWHGELGLATTIGKTAGSAPAGQPGAEKTQPRQTPAAPAEVEDLRQQMTTILVAQLTTLSNQPARVQFGRREPRITGTNMSQQGRFHTIQLEHLERNL